MRAVLKALQHVVMLFDQPVAVGVFVILTVATLCLLVPLPA